MDGRVAFLNVAVEKGGMFDVGQIIQNVYLKYPYLVRNYESGLSRFLRDRLSAPFAGRKDIFEALDEWLMSEKISANLLLAGNAGRGKSTLLVKWVESLRLRKVGSHRIIMVPISQTYGIDKDLDFFPALAGVLVSTFPYLGSLPIDIEQKRVFAQECLRKLADDNVELLLIVDGLDEAAGWSFDSTIFPCRPVGSAFRIISATRLEADDKDAIHCIRRMGWEGDSVVLLVDILKDSDVRELFSVASKGRYSDVDLDKLVALTKGEPLAARLLVSELESGEDVLQEQVVSRAKDALSRVMGSWIERVCRNTSETERDVVYRLLGVLSLARGGLTRSDLQRVLNYPPGTIDKAIKIARTVVAGDAECGYVLAHLSLSEALKTILVVGDYDLPKGFARLLTDSVQCAAHGDFDKVSNYVVDHALEHIWYPQFLFEVYPEFLSYSWLQAVFFKTGDTVRFQRFVRGLQERARKENLKAATGGKLVPYSAIEMLCVFWGAVAVEFQVIQIAKSRIEESEAAAELERIRAAHGEPWAPPIFDYEPEIRTLLELRERISPSLIMTWQSVADHVVESAVDALFCGVQHCSEEIVRLIKIIRQDFDLATHVSCLPKMAHRIEGLLYLSDSASAGDKTVYIDKIKNELAAHKSMKLLTETYVELAVRNFLPFEEAMNQATVYASRGHRQAKEGVDLAASLAIRHIEAGGDVGCLVGLYERFLAVVPPGDSSLCCPLLSVLLRFGTQEQRSYYLFCLLSSEWWGDIHQVISDCASAWDCQDVDMLSEALSNECCLVECLGDTKGNIFLQERNRDLRSHLLSVTTLFAMVSIKTSGQARANSFSKVMKFCEALEVSSFGEVASEKVLELLEEISSNLEQYDPSVKVQVERLNKLIHDYELKSSKPWAGWKYASEIWGLDSAQAATKILKLVRRWGQAAIAKCDFAALDMNVLKDLQEQALAMEEGETRDLALTAIENSMQKKARKQGPAVEALRYQKITISLARLLLRMDSPAAAVELALDAKEFGWPVLHELKLPEDWDVPSTLLGRLVELLSQWRILTARYPGLKFPYALAGQLDASHTPWVFVRPEGKHFESLAHMGELLRFVKFESRYAELEQVFLKELQKNVVDPWKVFSLARSVQRDVKKVIDVDGWVEALVGLLWRDPDFDVTGKLRLLLRINEFGMHDELWAAICEWATLCIEEVEDRGQRISQRHKIGLTMLGHDKEYCHALLKHAIEKPGQEIDHELAEVVGALLGSSPGPQVLSDIDEWVGLSTIENFHIRVEALAEDLTSNQLIVLLPHALRCLTFIGRSWNSELVFSRLSEAQCDEVFLDWINHLAPDDAEGYRRFLKTSLRYFSSSFSLGVLKLIFAGEEIDFWEELIPNLYERLNESDAALLIDSLLVLIVNNSHKHLALELFGRLSVDATLEVIDKLHVRGLVDAEMAVKTELAFRYPHALTREDIRSLQSLYRCIISLASAPAASFLEKDFAWGFVVGRVRDSITFVEAFENLERLVDLYQEFGEDNCVLLAAIQDAKNLLGG